MARCIYKVKNIFLAVFSLINKSDCLGFYCDSSFSFQVHIVKYLVLHFSFGKKARCLYQSVGKGALAMVDMRDNAKVSDFILSVYGHFYPPDKFIC